MIITHFLNYRQKTGSYRKFNLDKHPISSLKDAENVPCWSAGITYKGQRGKENISEINALVIDVDNDDKKGSVFVDLSDILEWMDDAELTGIVHTTKRHQKETHRFRVIVPTARPLRRSELRHETNRLIEVLNLNLYRKMIDEKSYEPAQLWLYPCYLPGASFKYEVFKGKKWEPEEYNFTKTFAGVELKSLDFPKLLESRNIKTGEQSGDWTRIECPWHPHQDSEFSAAYMHEEDKWPMIKCHAEKCEGKGLPEFLEYFGPDKLGRKEWKPQGDYKLVNQQGNPYPVYENFKIFLNKIGVEIFTDELLKVPFFSYDGKEEIYNNFHNEYLINEAIRDGMSLRASIKSLTSAEISKNRRNPIIDWIKSREWNDNSSAIDELFNTITFDDSVRSNQKDFYRSIFRKWIISIIACQFENRPFTKGVLVFQGPQSIGKTSWIRKLLPPELEEYINTGVTLDAQNKDSHKLAISCLICELGELDATFNKTDISRMKSFITQTEDIIRTPYATWADRYVRRTIFCASVNPKVFLNDDTGNSRWWAFPVQALDYFHKVDMQQVYAEAYFYWQNFDQDSEIKSYLLTPEEDVRLRSYLTEFESLLPYEEDVLGVFSWDEPSKYKITLKEICLYVFNTENPVPPREARAVSKVMQKLGHTARPGKDENNKPQRFYTMPPIKVWNGGERTKHEIKHLHAV